MLDSKSLFPDNRYIGHIRFLLDGNVKTIPLPVTGASLHAIAGNPTSLTSGGVEVPNNNDAFELKEDATLISKFTLATPAKLPPDGVEHAAHSIPVAGTPPTVPVVPVPGVKV